jgi:hypothetical protein
MADTIKLPGVGPVKKQYVYIVGAGLVVVGGVAWYRSRNASSSSAVVEPTESSPINPATGFPYGSTEDANALAGQGFSYSGGIIGGGGGGSSSGNTPAPMSFVTNSQWSQAAEAYLVDTVGLEANTVGNALGKYITGQPLDTAQVNIINQAIAFTGYPPVNGPVGNPPSYRTSAEPPVVTPTPVTMTAPKNLRATGVFTEHVDIDWDPVIGASGYTIWANGIRKTSNFFSQEHVWNLKSKTSHKLEVAAFTEKSGVYTYGPKASITVKTK